MQNRAKCLTKGAVIAFLEDKSMIEAQQQVIDQSPGRSPMALQFDRSIGHFRHLMATLIREEEALATEAAE